VAGRTNLVIGSVLSLAVAGVVAFGYHAAVATVGVAVASQDIPANSPISASDLSIEQVPAKYSQAAGGITDPSSLIGEFLTVATVPGEMIQTNMLAGTGSLQAVLSAYDLQHHTDDVLAQLSVNGPIALLIQAGMQIGISAANGNTESVLAPIPVLGSYTPSGGGSPTIFVAVPENEYIEYANDTQGTPNVILLPTVNAAAGFNASGANTAPSATPIPNSGPGANTAPSATPIPNSGSGSTGTATSTSAHRHGHVHRHKHAINRKKAKAR